MKDLVVEILLNDFIVNALICVILSQLIKPITGIFQHKKFDLKLALNDGGMPSSHSAVVASMAATAFYKCGASSPEFGICIIIAFIVMHDAKGVRMEAGKHAKALNDIVKLLYSGDSEIIFKELIGHTPLQVFGGLLLGLVVVIIRYNIGL